MKRDVLTVTHKNKLTKKRKNLFFVSTAMHLFNALEAQHYFQTTNNILVLLSFGNQKEDKIHIQKYLSFFPYDVLIVFDVGNAGKYHHITVRLLNILNMYTYDKFFLGYFSANLRRIACNVTFKEIYLYDDGTYTIALHNELYNKHIKIENSTKLIRRYSEKKRKNIWKQLKFRFYDYYREFYFKLYGYKNDFKKIELNFFTIFNLSAFEKEVIVRHSFQRLRQIFSEENSNTQVNLKKSVFFLGQPLYKSLYMNETTYISSIIDIKKFYEKNNKDFIYVPHRSEDNKIVNLLASRNLTIVKPKKPFEVYLFENGINSTCVSSFFSSALLTIRVLFPCIKVESFQIQFDEEKHIDIKAIYDSIKKESIHIYRLPIEDTQ